MRKKTQSEIKELFHYIEKQKKEGLPLLDSFKEYAKIKGLSYGSVRNSYYTKLSFLQNNTNFADQLQIDLSAHTVLKAEHFSACEHKAIIEKIDSLTRSGISVRRACLNMANGDKKLMLRYLNKYRTSKPKNAITQQVIKMPERKKKLTEEDISSLFFGLVKLLKKTTAEEIRSQFEAQFKEKDNQLKSALKSLATTKKEVGLLKQQLSLSLSQSSLQSS